MTWLNRGSPPIRHWWTINEPTSIPPIEKQENVRNCISANDTRVRGGKGVLPGDLDTARAALFFEQRRFHHFGSDPTGNDALYVRTLLGRIAELSGGTVTGPPDPIP